MTTLNIGFVLLTLILGGCAQKLPEVNETNCALESIQKIPDKKQRQEFAHKCLVR